MKCKSLISPHLPHSRPVLPSNGVASSRYYALCNKDAVNKGRGGVGGGSVDVSSTSYHNSALTADSISYRTHSILSGDIKKPSEQTTAACTVRGIGNTMRSGMPSPEGADRDNFNHRFDQITLQMPDMGK